MKTLLLATKNRGKVRELEELLAGEAWAAEVKVVSALDYPEVPEPEETGATFAENARLKAEAYARATGLTALADDSGLEIDALGGRPGVHSARYAADEAARIARVLDELRQAGASRPDDRTARFRCAMALAGADGRISAETDGSIEGRMLVGPVGDGGFGYDPIFFAPELGCSLAQAAPAAKNSVSHRGRALRAMLEHLRVAVARL